MYLVLCTLSLPRGSGLGAKYTFATKSTVRGSDGRDPSAIHRSTAAAANVQKSKIAKEDSLGRRASTVTSADGELRLMTVNCRWMTMDAVEISVLVVFCVNQLLRTNRILLLLKMFVMFVVHGFYFLQLYALLED